MLAARNRNSPPSWGACLRTANATEGVSAPTPEKQRVLKLTPAQPVRIAACLAECCHPLMSVLFANSIIFSSS